MQEFERVYMRTLRHIYDTEKQLIASIRMLSSSVTNLKLMSALRDIETQSQSQATRIEGIFDTLYLEARGEASWATTALLREAWDSASSRPESGTRGCAAALLAIKRYEITLYEALLRWSEHYEFEEIIPNIRRSIAEELVQASILSELAFGEDPADEALVHTERGALH